MSHTHDNPKTTATPADCAALARCAECFDDGQDTDVGRPTLDRLTALGWLDKVGRNRWEISPEGAAVLIPDTTMADCYQNMMSYVGERETDV
jgi:hypothetical protein